MASRMNRKSRKASRVNRKSRKAMRKAMRKSRKASMSRRMFGGFASFVAKPVTVTSNTHQGIQTSSGYQTTVAQGPSSSNIITNSESFL
jgi:hypothetical protein